MSAPDTPVAFDGVVETMRPLDDGRVRVTFTRFASPYYVPVARDADDTRAALLDALERSQATGGSVPLAWRLGTKELTLRSP